MIDAIMTFLFDRLLDDLWTPIIEAQYISAAAHVAFTLAFITIVSSDDQATCASKRRK